MPKHTARATCRLTAFGEAVLTFPYCPPMLDDLKAAVPYRHRDWDPARKVWTVEAAYADLAIDILLHHFPDAETPRRGRSHAHGQSRPEPQPIRRTDSAYALLHLMPSAPDALVDAAFRVLARHHHPDTAGGDGERMRALNDAYSTLKARVVGEEVAR